MRKLGEGGCQSAAGAFTPDGKAVGINPKLLCMRVNPLQGCVAVIQGGGEGLPGGQTVIH